VSRIACLVAAFVSVALLLVTYGPAASAGLTPVPCSNAEVVPSDPRFDALPNATAYYGAYEGGFYRFEVPKAWNGELALYMHGTNFGSTLSFSGPGNGLRAYWIEHGFAWGASTYRCNGFIPGIGLGDTILLRGIFRKITNQAEPVRSYVVGTSMGGFQTELALHAFPTLFDGGLAMCGMNSANWDLYVALGAASEFITGQRFTDPNTVADVQRRMIAVTGSPGSLTQKGIQFASVLINMSGGPRPFAMEGLVPPFNGVQTYQFLMSGSTLAGSTTPGNLTRANDTARYAIDPGLGLTAADLDAGVRRTHKTESIYAAFEETRPLSGKIERPLLTLYTTADYIVPVINAQALQRAVDAAGRSNLLVQRLIRSAGHCGYSDQEQVTAFGDLVRWVRDGVRPEGDNVFGDLTDAGRRFTNPLRPGDPGTVRSPRAPQAAAEGPAPARISPPATGDAGLE